MGVKPKRFYKNRKSREFGYSSRGQMWYRYMIERKIHFGRRRKSTGYIYLPKSRYCEAVDYLNLG